MHFFIAYFLGEISKFGIETLHTMRDNHLFTEKEALLGVLGIRYIYPKYFGYKVLLNTDFWV